MFSFSSFNQNYEDRSTSEFPVAFTICFILTPQTVIFPFGHDLTLSLDLVSGP